LQAVIRAEREGSPFLVYRDPCGELIILGLGPDRRELTIGRNRAADLSIEWDDQVSGLHAQLEQLAGELTLIDDGLSRNGSYVNSERVHGRRRVHDGDVLRFGRMLVVVRKPLDADRRATTAGSRPLSAGNLSEQQRRVLVALCRPLKVGDSLAMPATNRPIAGELYLSGAAGKLHLRVLFEKFGVTDLPQNKKRVALVRRAVDSGILSDHEFAPD
jgi:pSer/pThr/pTyr-binding forkhead associated (FHA) protein